jgi:hypothetical protein
MHECLHQPITFQCNNEIATLDRAPGEVISFGSNHLQLAVMPTAPFAAIQDSRISDRICWRFRFSRLEDFLMMIIIA